MTDVTSISRSQDLKDYESLLQALGTENKPDQWLVFMDCVTRLLATVLTVGKKSPKTIQESLIGRLGFTSWRQMIEASLEDGGLGWNWHNWCDWRRAYKIVQEYEYLRELKPTPSQVKTWDQEAKKEKIEFPETLEDHKQWREERKQNRETRHQETIAGLKKRVVELEEELEGYRSMSGWDHIRAAFKAWF